MNDKFSILMGKFLNLWGFILNFQFVLRVSLDHSHDKLKEINEQSLKDFLADPDFLQIFSKLSEDQKSTFISQNVQGAIKNANVGIDAIAIVLTHSILEAVIIDLIVLSYELQPNDWIGYIQERKIKFSELSSSNTDAIKKDLIEEYLAQLKKESLLYKCDRLMAICKPPAGFKIHGGFIYNRETLETIDKLRHDIVHGLQIKTQIIDVDNKIKYLHDTAVYFMALMAKKYNLIPQLDIVAKSTFYSN